MLCFERLISYQECSRCTVTSPVGYYSHGLNPAIEEIQNIDPDQTFEKKTEPGTGSDLRKQPDPT